MTDLVLRGRLDVPASTSNLGPGFDFLGLALSLPLVVEFELHPGPGELVLSALEGEAVVWPGGPENLLLRAFARAREAFDAPRLHGELRARSAIPVARGLGSSGAAIAAGLALGAHGARRSATLAELLRLGLEIEGHPDNVCAALAGGCTLSVPRPDGGVCLVRQALAPALGFVLAWPRTPLATARARERSCPHTSRSRTRSRTRGGSRSCSKGYAAPTPSSWHSAARIASTCATDCP
ncbi:MAG: hypothetical protein IPJ77_02640 [Planctomycetes bacterium]|nr:hypothetical protein [Planctomycetota bacterium]